MAVSTPNRLRDGRQPRRPLRLRWAFALALLLAAGAATVVWEHRGSSPRIVGVQAAATGDALFDRAAARCRLTPQATPRAGNPQPALLLGLHASLRLFNGGARCEEARLAQATGVSALREDISWASVEPRVNHYEWARTDALVRDVSETGLMLLPVLDDPPRWAAPAPTALPSASGPYAAFVAAIVARYGPGGTFWRAHPALPPRPIVWYELWNEPYFAEGADPAVYARLVRDAVTAGRAANPAARFLAEADTSYKLPDGSRADWIAGMYAAVPDFGRYFDALAVHPYGGDPAVYTPGGDTSEQPGRVAQVHAELVAHGDADKPLWVTEIGWSTCSGLDSCVTESQQASYLRSFLRLARTVWSSYVRAVFVYDLRDSGPNATNDAQAWFGLLAPDLSHKPAWKVLHDAATAAR